ncbi:MAG: hypothetical protein O7I42_14190 [Alphaproteobacteria bacterium]|nr:hypothetical protein [Alphaproteobacteria bacterium]
MTGYLTVNGQAVPVEAVERSGVYADGPRGQRYRIKVGQRFHRAGYTAVIWRATSIYFDALGLEHVNLVDEAGRLDVKTLSASVLLDRSHYRLI